MVENVLALRLAGAALGAVGGTLLFLELFLMPSYLEYMPELTSYNFDLSPDSVAEHTWVGRTGVALVFAAFALKFAATIVA